MKIDLPNRRLLLLLALLLSTCLLVTHAKGGRGGSRSSGSKNSGRGPSRRRPTYRPASRPSTGPDYRPFPESAPTSAPIPTPKSMEETLRDLFGGMPPGEGLRKLMDDASAKTIAAMNAIKSADKQPAYNPKPAPKSAQRAKPAPPSTKPSAPELPVMVKQPASNPNFKEASVVQGSADKQAAPNPNFKETSAVQGSAGKQPAYNPNYKPDGSPPAGPPPSYSPAGHPAPNAPAGPSPPYQPSAGQPPHYGTAGAQPPPYPGLPNARPLAYPGLPTQYPVQPSYPSQPGSSRPYPVQTNYLGSFNDQPGMNRPYPVQLGSNNMYPGGSRSYPQQTLGGNAWQPHHNMPAPAYMNYGGIPTGTNIYTKPYRKKGFIGSLMSVGKPKTSKPHKYYGSYPSPYASGGLGHTGGGFLGEHGKSEAMYTIFPYMAAKKIPKIKIKPNFGYMPMYMHRPYYHHYHHYHGHRHSSDDDDWKMNPEHAGYFDVYNEVYAGKCQQPMKKNNSEITCKSTLEEIRCDARCEEGYRFPHNIEVVSNKCWHITGVWRPKKNFPECKPVCENECMNGGECITPNVCKCPPEFHGSRCQFRKSTVCEKECMNGGECIRPKVCKCLPEFRGSRCQFHILKCDIQKLIKGENAGWVCWHYQNETICKISCKEPKHFESPPADEYKCTPDGVWKPDTIPHCIENTKDTSEVELLDGQIADI